MYADVLTTLRTFIAADSVLSASNAFSCIIADEADPAAVVEEALAKTGVTVILSIQRFDRRPGSGSILTGDLTFAIDAIENAALNRNGTGFLTAMRVSERLQEILHWHTFANIGLKSPMRFSSTVQADVSRESSIYRSTYVAEYAAGGNAPNNDTSGGDNNDDD